MEQRLGLALQLVTVVLLAIVAFQLAGIAKGIDTLNSYESQTNSWLQAICKNTIPSGGPTTFGSPPCGIQMVP